MKKPPLRAKKHMKGSQIKSKPVNAKTKRKRLEKLLWSLMSQYVRERDNYTCVTCGRIMIDNPGAAHAGHFKHGGLDYCELNINCQCNGCNTFRNGKLDMYASYLGNKYGWGIIDRLEREKNMNQKFTLEELQELIDYYSSKEVL